MGWFASIRDNEMDGNYIFRKFRRSGEPRSSCPACPRGNDIGIGSNDICYGPQFRQRVRNELALGGREIITITAQR
jgi:hypothetical protein